MGIRSLALIVCFETGTPHLYQREVTPRSSIYRNHVRVYVFPRHGRVKGIVIRTLDVEKADELYLVTRTLVFSISLGQHKALPTTSYVCQRDEHSRMIHLC